MLLWPEDVGSIRDQAWSGESGQGRVEKVLHSSSFEYFQVKLTNFEMPLKDNHKNKCPKQKRQLRYMIYLFPFICMSCLISNRKSFLQTCSVLSPSQIWQREIINIHQSSVDHMWGTSHNVLHLILMRTAEVRVLGLSHFTRQEEEEEN